MKVLKNVYLTIDDSPSLKMKEKIDFLFERKIPAIFFCIGQQVEFNPELVKYAIQKGFSIGNHSYSHPHFSEISFIQAKEEILKTEVIIDQLYEDLNIERANKYFRFPYGDKGDGLNGFFPSLWKKSDKIRKTKIQDLLSEMGFQGLQLDSNYDFYEKVGFHEDLDWHWTFDTIDYSTDTIENEILNRLENLKASNPLVKRLKENYWLSAMDKSEIILIHDHSNTHELFFKIISKLQALPLHFQEIP